MRSAVVSLLSLALVPVVNGCIIVGDDPPLDPYGEIAFDWSFGGVTDCGTAGVDFVDVHVFENGQLVLDVFGEPCFGGGLVLTEIHTGFYDVQVSAFARDEEMLYEGSFTARVDPEATTDVGLVELDPVGYVPPPAEGDVDMFWEFRYPSNNGTDLCDFAGVNEVRVRIEDDNGNEVYDERSNCNVNTYTVGPLATGDYIVRLTGIGEYDNDDINLYDSGELAFEITDGDITDLGHVVLDRIDASFADFAVSWDFASSTCANEGVTDVRIAITRFGFDEPEYDVTLDCDALAVEATPFVPGSYTVDAFAVGDFDNYVATTTIDVPPNHEGQVQLVLAPES